ncbi:MAG: hypothetical protein ACXAC5_02095 [Promethearchaeota archaeon]|jgi:hypothetical protein
MKFGLFFKTPDVLDHIREDDSMTEDQRDEAEAFANNFLDYGENITVEFDTEAGTAVARRKAK